MDNYQQIADRYEAAFEAFKHTYSLRIPPPALPKKIGANRTTIALMVILLVASMIVSGSRTIVEFATYSNLPTQLGIVVGVAAFIMLDVGMISYAYTRTRNHYSAERHEAIKLQLDRAKYLALAILIAANLHFILRPYLGVEAPAEDTAPIVAAETTPFEQTLKTIGGIVSGVINLTINILVAISAPVMAYMAGDIMAQQAIMQDRAQRQLDTEYDQRLAEWMDALNKSWSSQQKKWGVDISLSAPSNVSASNSVQLDSGQWTDNGQSRSSGHGFNRTADAKQRVIEYFEANPDDLTANIGSRELSDRIGNVGKSTVANVRSQLLSQNGHGGDSENS